MGDFPEYERYDGLGLAALVRGGEISPAELVEAAAARIERENPRLNAVIHPMFDQARAAAAGPLPDAPFRGVPMLLKDLVLAVAGEPLRSGSRALRDYVPPADSELVRRYRAAGVVILGKTNTPEFGLTPVTEPSLFGPTRNPWDLRRTPGGSSGGSAAAVAAGMVPIASGGDGGGSIRIPASCCALFGLKPTRGRTPTGPYMTAPWEGMAIDHVLTRSVRDSAAMLDVTAGRDPGAPYDAPTPIRPYLKEVGTPPGRLRIAFTTFPFLGQGVDPACVAGVGETVALLEELGHELVEDRPLVDRDGVVAAFATVLAGQVSADVAEIGALFGRQPRPVDYEPETWLLSLLGREIAAADYVRAVRLLQRTAREIGRFFEEYDVLLTPTLAAEPLLLGQLRPPPLLERGMGWVNRFNAGWLPKRLGVVPQVAAQTFAFIPYTPLFNITGQPAMSVPLHWSAAGLPVGMHFVGRFGDEGTLFRLAGQLEEARPWFDRRPRPAAV